jgi:hypothetical protein
MTQLLLEYNCSKREFAMSDSSQLLLERVEELERELLALKQMLPLKRALLTPLQNAAIELGLWQSDRESAAGALEEIRRELRNLPEAISIEELQRRSLEEGIRPEDNVFSKGIVDMREE